MHHLKTIKFLSRLLPLVLALPLSAHALTYPCIGKINQVTVGPGGDVNASFSFQGGVMEWQTVCNVAETANSVAPAACKSILAVLVAAHATDRNVQMFFSADTANCSATPWTTLRDHGWYWGPSLQ